MWDPNKEDGISPHRRIMRKPALVMWAILFATLYTPISSHTKHKATLAGNIEIYKIEVSLQTTDIRYHICTQDTTYNVQSRRVT